MDVKDRGLQGRRERMEKRGYGIEEENERKGGGFLEGKTMTTTQTW